MNACCRVLPPPISSVVPVARILPLSKLLRSPYQFSVVKGGDQLAQLRDRGADVAKETQDMDGVGRFGWVTDPEGNRIELWQPA